MYKTGAQHDTSLVTSVNYLYYSKNQNTIELEDDIEPQYMTLKNRLIKMTHSNCAV